MLLIPRVILVLFIAWISVNSMKPVIATSITDNSLSLASHYLEQGHFFLALQEIDKGLQGAMTQPQKAQAMGLKGHILLLMQRYKEAEEMLLQAYDLAEETPKGDFANSLGVLYYELRDKTKSIEYFKVALSQASSNPALTLKVKLNWLRTEPHNTNTTELESLLTDILNVESIEDRVKYALNLASIASQSSLTSTVINTALEKAYTDSHHISNQQLRLEALDSLAEFYDKQGKFQEALALSEQADAITASIDADDLLINIEWRKGRIYERYGRDTEALIAYRKAVDHIQTIRRDIPVTYEDGRSSFREKLEPIYLGYAHQLLKKASQQHDTAKQLNLKLARQTIELIKQTELEDYLGGRCLIEGLQRNELESMDQNAAILYPIILPDRLELLVSMGQTIHQFTVPIAEQNIRQAALNLSNHLRNWLLSPREKIETRENQQEANNLYRWMISPIESELQKQSIKTLVIVPDGILRLVPFSALFDGKQYLIEKYAVSISPGMSLMGSTQDITSRSYRSLLAGISKPGSVVEKLPEVIINEILLTASNETRQRDSSITRRLLSHHLRSAELKIRQTTMSHPVERMANYTQTLQSELSLPGVEVELNTLKNTLKNTTLFNEQFTVNNFYQQVANQPYEIIHIASHGLFSTDANQSFLMAYDDIIKLDDFKSFLKRDRNTQNRIQLLTLSACETAEGDDRAPLGFTGVALKADAQSALGSLWPISDEAASQLMIHFYQNLTKHQSKTESLRQAQLALLNNPKLRHPSFWSPFILVGNWL